MKKQKSPNKENKKSRWKEKSAFGLVMIIGLLFFLWPVPLMQGNPEQVAKAQIFNGNTGELYEITQKEKVEELLDYTDGVYGHFVGLKGETSGVGMVISLYDESGKKIGGAEVQGAEHFVGYGTTSPRYRTYGTVDVDYLYSLGTQVEQ